MKSTLVLAILLSLLNWACSPKTNYAPKGSPQSTSNPPASKPSFPGSPGNFTGTWVGKGTINNFFAANMPATCTVVISHTLDGSGIPKTVSFSLNVADKGGDIVYSVNLNGYTIDPRKVDESTTIYEFHDPATKIMSGEIGNQGFAFAHSRTDRKIQINLVRGTITLKGFKIVGTNKTNFAALLTKQ